MMRIQGHDAVFNQNDLLSRLEIFSRRPGRRSAEQAAGNRALVIRGNRQRTVQVQKPKAKACASPSSSRDPRLAPGTGAGWVFPCDQCHEAERVGGNCCRMAEHAG